MTSVKIDLKAELEAYAARRGSFSLVQVPPLQYLMVDGHGDPNTSAYADAISAIYPVAYTIKFVSKIELGRDYVVMPLEALWWSGDMASFTTQRDKSRWDWTLMNLVPDWITEKQVRSAREAAARKTGSDASDKVVLQSLDEGLCVQTLHVGSYDDEGPVLQAMHDDYLPQHGLRMTGKHHEIYLSDARRTPPAKLRTILRQPVTRG